MYIRDIKKVKKEISALKAEADKLYAKANAKAKELQQECHHPQQYVKTEESYFSGSYLDRASTTKTPICTLCGARGESKTESHSWYG